MGPSSFPSPPLLFFHQTSMLKEPLEPGTLNMMHWQWLLVCLIIFYSNVYIMYFNGICIYAHVKILYQTWYSQKEGKSLLVPATHVSDLIWLIITSPEWGSWMEAHWGIGSFPFYASGRFPEESFVSKYLLRPLGERQKLSSSIWHITPMETPIIQSRDPQGHRYTFIIKQRLKQFYGNWR